MSYSLIARFIFSKLPSRHGRHYLVVGYLWLVFLFVSFVVCCVPFWDVSMPLFVLSMKRIRGSTKGGQLIKSSFLFGGSRAWLTRINKTPNAYQNIGSLILDPEARVSIFHHLRTLPSHTKRLLEDLAPRNLERAATFGRFQNRRWILRSKAIPTCPRVVCPVGDKNHGTHRYYASSSIS